MFKKTKKNFDIFKLLLNGIRMVENTKCKLLIQCFQKFRRVRKTLILKLI